MWRLGESGLSGVCNKEGGEVCIRPHYPADLVMTAGKCGLMHISPTAPPPGGKHLGGMGGGGGEVCIRPHYPADLVMTDSA